MADVSDVSYLAVPGGRIGGGRLGDMDRAVFQVFETFLAWSGQWTGGFCGETRGSRPVRKPLGTFGPSRIIVSNQGSVSDAGQGSEDKDGSGLIHSVRDRCFQTDLNPSVP